MVEKASLQKRPLPEVVLVHAEILQSEVVALDYAEQLN
jgi:hypothetical protein